MSAFSLKQTIKADEQVVAVAISDDDEMAAYGTSDVVVLCRLVIDAGDGVHTLQEVDRVDVACRSLVFNRRNALLCGGDSDIVEFDVSAGALRRRSTLEGHDDVILGLTVSGNVLASSGQDCTVRLWSMWSARRVQLACLNHHTEEANAVCMSRDKQWLLSGSWDQTVVVYRRVDASLAWHTTLTLGTWVNAVGFSPDDALLAVGALKGCSAVYAVDGGAFALLHRLSGAEHQVYCVAWLDATTLVGGTNNGALVVWRAPTGGVKAQMALLVQKRAKLVNALASYARAPHAAGGGRRRLAASARYA